MSVLPQPAEPTYVTQFRDHIAHVTSAFDEAAQEFELGVRLSADFLFSSPANYLYLAETYANKPDDTGVLHEQQLKTALKVVKQLLDEPNRSGVVLGAMQSGKTTTALALQFAGPIIYRHRGTPVTPLYLVTSHTSHAHQTKVELNNFLQYYDMLAVVPSTGRNTRPLAPSKNLKESFVEAPTLRMYRNYYAKPFQEALEVPSLDDFVRRRTWGQNTVKIAETVEKIAAKDCIPLMIVDEPQFGAGDHVRIDPDTQMVVQVECVFARILNEIEKRLKIAKDQHFFVAISATPFELGSLDTLWHVPQVLGDDYVGFNFNPSDTAQAIDPNANIRPPRVLGMSAFANEHSVPFFADINMNAYEKPAAFARFARRIAFQGNHDDYRRACRDAIEAVLVSLVRNESKSGKAFGVCLRLVNNNRRVTDILAETDLARHFDILPYYGEKPDASVKKEILDRKHADKPFLVLVTNRARMGDAFPRDVKYFFEFATRFTDVNSMMQGLIGRACGYRKESTVVVSDVNYRLLQALINTNGVPLMSSSRYSIVAGKSRSRLGAPVTFYDLQRRDDDPVSEVFFAAFDRDVVNKQVNQNVVGQLRNAVRRGPGMKRRAPIVQMLESAGVLAHIETDAVRGRISPEYPPFKIARLSDSVPALGRAAGRALRYDIDQKDATQRFTFREERDDRTRASLRARGRTGNATSDEDELNLQPQVILRKVDAQGRVVRDDRKGRWTAVGIILPLTKPAHLLPVMSGTGKVEILPRRTAWATRWIKGAQEINRDAAEGKSRRTARRRNT